MSIRLDLCPDLPGPIQDLIDRQAAQIATLKILLIDRTAIELSEKWEDLSGAERNEWRELAKNILKEDYPEAMR